MDTAQAPQLMGLLPMVLVFIVFYFMVIMPHKKQQKEHKQMLNDLKQHDKVITSGGMHGVIVNVVDDIVTLKIDDNTKIKIDKAAINSKVS